MVAVLSERVVKHGGGAEQRVTREVELTREIEDMSLEPVRLARRSEEHRLELPQFACERLHQLRLERLVVQHDAEAVALQRLLGEDIADVELEFHLGAW